MYSFPNFEPVCCSMSGSNGCFLIAYRFCRRRYDSYKPQTRNNSITSRTDKQIVAYAHKGALFNAPWDDLLICATHDPQKHAEGLSWWSSG